MLWQMGYLPLKPLAPAPEMQDLRKRTHHCVLRKMRFQEVILIVSLMPSELRHVHGYSVRLAPEGS